MYLRTLLIALCISVITVGRAPRVAVASTLCEVGRYGGRDSQQKHLYGKHYQRNDRGGVDG